MEQHSVRQQEITKKKKKTKAGLTIVFLGFPCSEVETNGRGRRSGGRSVRPLSVHPLRTDLYATRQPQSPRPARVRTNAALQLPDLLHLFLAQKQRHSTLGQEAQRQNERFFFIAPPSSPPSPPPPPSPSRSRAVRIS